MAKSTEIGSWRKYLYYASRSRSFLWRVALGTFIGCIALGFLASRWRKPAPHLFAERVLARAGLPLEKADPDQLKNDAAPQLTTLAPPDILTPFKEELANPSVRFSDVMYGVPALARHFHSEDIWAAQESLKIRFGALESILASDFLEACNPMNSEAYARLKLMAESSVPLRYANYALASVEMNRKNFGDAYRHFRREAERPEAFESRYGAVNALVQGEDFATLQNLMHDPAFVPYLSAYVRLKVAGHDKDWRAILKWVPLGQLESYEWRIVTLSLIAGCAWAFFLAHLGEFPSVFSSRTLLCAAGFLLGALSTTPTLYLVVIENDILHFSRGTEQLGGFLYDIGGVGLREEVCKLFLFIPLLPFLIKRGTELDALIVACFVGLGFAVEENAGYFMNSEASDVAGRFLSANFFHIALTGTNGLALFRVFSRDSSDLNDFLFVFPLTILAHGIYDALLELPSSDFAGYLPMTVYVAFSMFFFSRATQLRGNLRMTIGLTGAFVFSVSLVLGAVIIHQMTNLGAQAGMLVAGSEMLGSAALMFMFFREFNEQLSA